MILYRNAERKDWRNIAQLHAHSWKIHYRGIVTDDYLDNHVENERKEVWRKRFEQPNKKQITILAEEEEKLIGFTCVFLDADETYGTLLDNLHVHPDRMRHGIGKVLMIKSAESIIKIKSNTSMYLWVLTANEKAISFYEKLGGARHETHKWKTPDNTNPETYRYVWDDLSKLSKL